MIWFIPPENELSNQMNVSWLLPPAYLPPSSVYPFKDHVSLIKTQCHWEITKLMFFFVLVILC